MKIVSLFSETIIWLPFSIRRLPKISQTISLPEKTRFVFLFIVCKSRKSNRKVNRCPRILAVKIDPYFAEFSSINLFASPRNSNR
jgi:hypothetical protein